MMQSNNLIGVIAGEDIDMPPDFIQKNGIKIYDYNLFWEGVLQDNADIYKKMRESKEKKNQSAPHTSQPSVGLLKELFDETLKEYDEAFVITISSKLSGCYSCALQAVEKLDPDKKNKVHVIESSFFSSGSAFMVRELLDGLRMGQTVEEIKKKLNDLRTQITMIGMIEDSFWLQKGGRINTATAIILNQMKKVGVRPLLAAQDGKIVLLKVRTHASTKVQGIFEYFSSQVGGSKVDAIITHADNAAEAAALQQLIQSTMPAVNVLYITELSPVLGAHVGPDTLILGWRLLP